MNFNIIHQGKTTHNVTVINEYLYIYSIILISLFLILFFSETCIQNVTVLCNILIIIHLYFVK